MFDAIVKFATGLDPVVGLALTGLQLYQAYQGYELNQSVRTPPTQGDITSSTSKGRVGHITTSTVAKHGGGGGRPIGVTPG